MKTNKTVVWLAGLIAVLATVAAALGVFWRGGGGEYVVTSLRGEQVRIQGSGLYQFDSVSGAAQGIAQDVVTLLLGIPLLIIAAVLYQRGSLRGTLLLAGTLGYFLYTYASYSFLLAYNQLFLVYVTLFAASLFAFVLTLMSINVEELATHFSAQLPTRWLAGLSIFLGAAVAMLWLGRIGPPLLNGGVPAGLDSYTTLVIQALDLGVLMPTAVLAGVLLWQKRPFGYLLTAVMLLKGVTMLTAISAMAVGMLLANVEVSAAELVVFPVFNVLVIIATVVLLRGVVEQPKDARESGKSTERATLASAALGKFYWQADY